MLNIAKGLGSNKNVESERDLLPLGLPCSGKALLRKHQMNRREELNTAIADAIHTHRCKQFSPYEKRPQKRASLQGFKTIH